MLSKCKVQRNGKENSYERKLFGISLLRIFWAGVIIQTMQIKFNDSYKEVP